MNLLLRVTVPISLKSSGFVPPSSEKGNVEKPMGIENQTFFMWFGGMES